MGIESNRKSTGCVSCSEETEEKSEQENELFMIYYRINMSKNAVSEREEKPVGSLT